MNSVSAAPPSRVRYLILWLLCSLAMITYMDRAANGNARNQIIDEVNASLPEGEVHFIPGLLKTTSRLTYNDFQIVLLAFQFAYALFEIPSGWMGDTRGPRSTLLRVVIWWSMFVALIGFAGMQVGPIVFGFLALVVIQFLFGMGEAGAFPNISKAIYYWFPAGERGFAKSAVWMSARLMGGLTPLLWVLLTAPEFGGMTWRESLWLFAGVAVVWCIVFAFAFTNRPTQHRLVNAGELEHIDAGRPPHVEKVEVPWGRLIRSRNLWAVCLMYVVTNFCWYFLMYNHPAAMRKEFASWEATPFGKIALALMIGAPLIIGMFGCYLGGVLSDRYIRRTGDRRWGRRRYGMFGYGMAGVCYLLAIGGKLAFPGNLWAFAIPLVLMGFFNDLIMAPAWAVCQDIGRHYSATVSGAMNMFGNLFGAVSGIFITKLIIDTYTTGEGKASQTDDMGYVVCFSMYAAVYFVGALLWTQIDASKPIVDEVPVQVDDARA